MIMQPYAPRATRWLETIEHGSWRLKLYSIALDAPVADATRFQNALHDALATLPAVAPETGRPGVGFVIMHQGRGCDYLVLAWWDRENELPLRILVRAHEGGDWRAARGGESVCVWDLEIIAFERDAYVRSMLTGRDPATGEYLAAHFSRL